MNIVLTNMVTEKNVVIDISSIEDLSTNNHGVTILKIKDEVQVLRVCESLNTVKYIIEDKLGIKMLLRNNGLIKSMKGRPSYYIEVSHETTY